MSQTKKPDTRTDAEKLADWRAKRGKPLDTPKGKYKWGTKSSGKKESEK